MNRSPPTSTAPAAAAATQVQRALRTLTRPWLDTRMSLGRVNVGLGWMHEPRDALVARRPRGWTSGVPPGIVSRRRKDYIHISRVCLLFRKGKYYSNVVLLRILLLRRTRKDGEFGDLWQYGNNYMEGFLLRRRIR